MLEQERAEALDLVVDAILALVRSASVDKDLMAAVPKLKIVFVDDYQAAFTALRERKVDSFLADELLLLSFAQRSGAPKDFALIADYALPLLIALQADFERHIKVERLRFISVIFR